MRERIRIGIIGAGNNAVSVHIPEFKKIPGVEIVTVCNRSMASGEKVARLFAIPNVVTDPRRIFDDQTIDAVLIGTWPHLHHDLTILALEAGKHVLCEARMAMNLVEAMNMLRVSKMYPRLVVQLVPARFTFAYDNTIVNFLGNKILGDVLSVEVQHTTGTFLDRLSPLIWRQDYAKSGNNILTMGIWYECVLRWLGEARQVFALGKVFQNIRCDREKNQAVEVRIPDHLEVLANFSQNMQLRMQFSSITGLSESSWIKIFGSDATLQIDLLRQKMLLGNRNDRSFSEYVIDESDKTVWEVEKSFIDSITRKTPVTLTNFIDGVKYMTFTEAVSRSLATKKMISMTSLTTARELC
jgi:predicted dehydrogenase